MCPLFNKVGQAVTMETNVYLGTGAQCARRKIMASMHARPGTKMVTRRACCTVADEQ